MKEIDPNLPVNKSAKFVVSKDLTAKREQSRQHKIISSKPIPFIPFHGKWSDLKLKRIGRLTLLGLYIYATKRRKKHGLARCVVKCDCGKYEVRNIKNLLKENAFDDSLMCHECWLNVKLKEKEYWMKTGMNKCRYCGKSFKPEDLIIHHKTKCK